MRTKEEFFQAGRDAGFIGTVGHEWTGWRASAFASGYAVGAAARAAARTPGKSTVMPAARLIAGSSVMQQKRKVHFRHWPGAAAEHLRQLALQIVDEEDQSRIERLLRACARLAERHGQPKSNDEVFRILGWDEAGTFSKEAWNSLRKTPQDAPGQPTTQQKEQA